MTLLPRRQCPQDGFVMPVAITGMLVLALSSLSMQASLLQARKGQSLSRQGLQQGDRLASGAQRLAALLLGPAACLKPLPASQWSLEVLPMDCAPSLDPEDLRSFLIDGQRLKLVNWTPGPEGGEIELQLADQGQSARFQLTPSGLRERG